MPLHTHPMAVAAILAIVCLPTLAQPRKGVTPEFLAPGVSKGNIYTVAGNPNGQPGYYGDGGLAINAELNGPQAVAFDSAGNLYISDTNNNVIRRVSAVTGIITTFAGGGGCEGSNSTYCGDGGPATQARLLGPLGLAFDENWNLFIADTGNNAVRKVDAKTGVITTAAGNGTAGSAGNNVVATSAELDQPYSVAFSPSGNLYIADYKNGLVREVTEPQGIISNFAGTGVGCTGGTAIGDGCPAIDGTIATPEWITFDQAGNLYIADPSSGRVRIINTQGVINTFAGGSQAGCPTSGDPLNDGCPPDDVYFQFSNAIAFNPSGDLLVSDLYPADTIQDINMAPQDVVESIAGVVDGHGLNGDGGLASDATLDNPCGMAFDTLGNLYIADISNNVIRAVVHEVPPLTPTPLISPAGGTFDTKQKVTISDSASTAVIFYTSDGSQPTTLSRQYAGPITVAATATIHAIAVIPQEYPSQAASETYKIVKLSDATPIISPPGGFYHVEQFATITEKTAGAQIHYTTDGSEPTMQSPRYSVPIPIASDETIRAIAISQNDARSSINSESYRIAGAPTTLVAPATNVTTSSAMINGAIDPLGAAAHYNFEYGTSATELTKNTSQGGLAGVDKAVQVSAQLTGLKAQTTYYYRVVATTVGGASASAVTTFNTK